MFSVPGLTSFCLFIAFGYLGERRSGGAVSLRSPGAWLTRRAEP